MTIITAPSTPEPTPEPTIGAPDSRADLISAGWTGPARIVSPLVARRLDVTLRARFAAERRRHPDLPAKQRALRTRWLGRLAADDDIVDLVRSMIGPDVVLWGASITTREPGRRHDWHVDIEVAGADPGTTVNVWIPLHGGGADSGLVLLAGSHELDRPVQRAAFEAGLDRAALDDEGVVALAAGLGRELATCRVAATPGQAVAFDGRLWHASVNESDTTRRALLLQYARPDARLALAASEGYGWPFRFSDRPVQCVPVAGSARSGPNEIVEPITLRRRRRATLPAMTAPLEIPPGGRSHQVGNGHTASGLHLTCHVATLAPGQTPHPPHTHREEEVLVVLRGAFDVTLADRDGTVTSVRRLGEGGVLYYPLDQAHTLTGASDPPVVYAVVKWRSNRISRRHGALRAQVFDRADPEPSEGGRRSGLEVFAGPTRYLRRLQVHRSRLPAGAGYEPHRDTYDVALITLEGSMDTLGATIAPHSFAWYPMGTPHGLRNVGDDEAHYVAIELHGADLGSLLNPHMARAVLRRTLRWPRRALRRFATR